MSMLNIDEVPELAQPEEHQAISTKVKPPSASKIRYKPSMSKGLRNLRIDSAEGALVLFQPPGDSLVAPKTPSHIPVLSKSEALIATPATPSRTPKISPQKAQFLTKDSNITGFTAWDVNGRMESMEAIFGQLKDKLSGTDNALLEAVALYKERRKLLYTGMASIY
jgi:kinesin family protein C1